MNRLFIIGNLTRDGELRTTQTGRTVYSFTVAVNRRKKTEGQPDADFFNVSVWDELANNCAKYLAKGKKVAVIGAVSLDTYTKRDGGQGANLRVVASEVEFLTPKQETEKFQAVEDDDLPWDK